MSVILPTYERRDLVHGAVASVLAQTFRDFELIVVDDGSRDGTRQALPPLADSIRYLRQNHRGCAAARNAGVAYARGEVVAFLDDDDRWVREHLAVIVSLMRRHPEAVLASTSPGYRRWGWEQPEQMRLTEPFPAILTRGMAGFVPSTAVLRAELEAIGGFNESLASCEDCDLWLRLALRGPFVLLNRRTAKIRCTAGSVSARACRDGTQLSAYWQSLRSVETQLQQAGNATAAAQVRAARQYIDALWALGADDPELIAEKLRDACEVLPDLAEEWGFALHLFGLLPSVVDPSVRLRHLRTLADAWPDHARPTPLALSAHAALASLRLAHPRTTARLLRNAPLSELIRFTAAGEARTLRFHLKTLSDIRRELVRRSLHGVVDDPHDPARLPNGSQLKVPA